MRPSLEERLAAAEGNAEQLMKLWQEARAPLEQRLAAAETKAFHHENEDVRQDGMREVEEILAEIAKLEALFKQYWRRIGEHN